MQKTELKVWHNGLLRELLLTLPSDIPWDEALVQAEARLDETRSNSAWRGAQLTIDLGARPVAQPDLGTFVERLKADYDLLTVAVVATDTLTRDAAKRLTLNAYSMPPEGNLAAPAELAGGGNALYLPQTIRSGQRVLHGGHIIIGGDVNSGAEVIAGGDIVILGTLRGLAHAGSQGNESARIFAGCMRPQQLRIASHIARSPEGAGPGPRQPEVARVENGEIQVSLV